MVIGEEFRDTFSERTCALSVNDVDTFQASKKRVVKKLVNQGKCFVPCHSSEVEVTADGLRTFG